MWTHLDHLISHPVLFEGCGHFLITCFHSQFRSRDWDNFWSPGLTPSFVWEIWTLPDHDLIALSVSFIEMWTPPDHQVSLPVSFERCGHILITRSHSQFRGHLVPLPVSFERCWHILTTWSHSQFCSRGMCTLSDHLVSLPVSFERFVHFLNARSNSQFHSRDIDTSCPPGLTPCFVREIWTLSDRQDSLPVLF
jgi:uncharacterized protein (DUF2384 family)